jgi:polyisoprenoid-binding protein YceI
MAGTLTFDDGKLTAAQGTIDPSTVDTGIGKLNHHLQTADFFDVATFPKITMKSTQIVPSDDGVTITGRLGFHGVTHEVSFPAKVEGNTVSADFRLDTTPFGMKYAGVNKEVRIQFELMP